MTLSRDYNYSSLASAYQCQQLYKYQYIDGLKSPQTGDLAFGSAIHYAIEQSLLGEPDPLFDFKTYWDHTETLGLKYGRFKHDDLKHMGEVIVSRFHNKYSPKIKPRVIEQEIKYRGFKGTPDCVGEYDGKMSVIDFKTSGIRYPKDKAFISDQMHLYAWMSEHVHGVDIKQLVYMVFLKGPTPVVQVIQQPYDKAHSAHIIDNLKQQVRDLERKVIDKVAFTRNLNNCIKGEFKCPFYNLCWEAK